MAPKEPRFKSLLSAILGSASVQSFRFNYDFCNMQCLRFKQP